MNNALLLLLALSAVPAGYLIVTQEKELERPPEIRRLSEEELAQPPLKLSEFQKQPATGEPLKLPPGVQALP